MPDQFGGIEVDDQPRATDQFGGVRIGEPQRDQFGGIRVGYPPPPRAKPEPPGVRPFDPKDVGASDEGDISLAADTPAGRILSAGAKGFIEPFQQPRPPGPGIADVLEQHRMPGFAGVLQKYGLNPLSEAGAVALGAALKGIESAFGGVTGAGGQAIDEATQAIYRAAGDHETADLIAAHPGWTARAANEYLASVIGAEGGKMPKPGEVATQARAALTKPSTGKTVLDNIATGRPAGAPPAGEPAAPAAQAPPGPSAPAATAGASEPRPLAPLTPTPETTPGMWPEAPRAGATPEPVSIPSNEAAKRDIPPPSESVVKPASASDNPVQPPAKTAPSESPPRRPMDIIEFLARTGGIATKDAGDLRAMDLHKKFIPGAGMLVRRNGGKSLDYAREAAEEAGYLPEGSTTADLIDAIDRSNRGQGVFSHRDTGDVVAWKDAQLAQRRASTAAGREGEGGIDPDLQRHEMERRAELAGVEHHPDMTNEELLAAIHEREAMQAEGEAMGPHADHMAHDLDRAVERALPEEHDDVPGFEPLEPRARPAESADKAGERPEAAPGEAPSGEGAGEIVPGDREAAPEEFRESNQIAQRSVTEHMRERFGVNSYVSNVPIKWRDESGQPRVKKSDYARASEDHRAAVLDALKRGDDVPTKAWVTYRYDDAFQPYIPPELKNANLGPRIAQEEATRSAKPTTERTAQGEQRVMPGMERSARQAAEAREAEGRGKATTKTPQKPADEGLFAKPSAQPDMFDKPTRDAAHAAVDAQRADWKEAKAGEDEALHADFARFVAARGGMPDSILGRMKMVANYVLERGRATGHESLVGMGNDGSVLEARTQGKPNAVMFTKVFGALLDNRNERIITHHNHPSGNALSGSDITTLHRRGHDTVIAHGHDDSISAARLAPGIWQALHDAEQNVMQSAAEMLRSIHAVAEMTAIGILQPLVHAKTITAEAAMRAHTEILMRALDAARVIDYVTSRRLEDLLPKEVLDRAFSSAAYAAKDAAERRGLVPPTSHNEKIANVRLYRPSEPLRPDDAMARILERAAGDAERRVGPARDQARAPDARREGETGPPAAAPRNAGIDKRGQYRLLEREDERGLEAPPVQPALGGLPPGGAPPGGGGAGGPGGRPPRQGQMNVTTPQQVRRNGIIARSIIGKIFSPSTVSPKAEAMAGLAREELGQARRLTQQARDALEKFRADTPHLGTPEGNDLMAYMEGRSAGATLANPAHQPLADYVRRLNQNRAQMILQLPKYQQRQFINDYFAHMWKDPQQAQQVFSTTSGGSRQGSGRNLKQRTIPTYADGIAAGLEPLHPNIVDGEMAYLSNIDRFIAHERIFERMRANGMADYFAPGKAPDGWRELNGRLEASQIPTQPQGAIPLKAYAHEDVARVYNNLISKGIYGTDLAPIYDKLLRVKNGMTAMELLGPAFHTMNMVWEAFASDLVRGGFGAAMGRDLGARARGVGTMLASPAGIARNLMTGRNIAKEYLQPGTQSTAIANAVGLLTKANFAPPIGRGAQQYFTAQRGAYKSFRDFGAAMREAGKDIGAHPLAGPFRQFMQQGARLLDTTAAPLFDYAIPRIKAGASARRMIDWLDQHPQSSHAEQLEAARNISDSIDNRMGELNYDNLMWHAGMKQAAWLGMRAFGWALGNWRETAGGVADLARGKITERAGYVAALAAATAFSNGLATYLMTGKPPQSPQDFYAYDSGKKDDRGNEIRAMFPGFARELATLAGNIHARGMPAVGSYAYGKLASAWTTAYDLMTNRDFRDDPIYPPDAGVSTEKGRAELPEFFKRTFGEIAQHYIPINMRQFLEPDRSTEGLSTAEKVLAIRKAPLAVSDPDAAKKMFDRIAAHPKSPQEKWKAKLKREERARRATETATP